MFHHPSLDHHHQHHHQPIQTVDVHGSEDLESDYEFYKQACHAHSSAVFPMGSFDHEMTPPPSGEASSTAYHPGPGSYSEYGPQDEGEEDGEEEDDAQLAHLSKEELRKHKNRQSAARSRQRMRNRLEELERMVLQLSESNQLLEHEVQALAMQQMMATRMAPPPPPAYHGY